MVSRCSLRSLVVLACACLPCGLAQEGKKDTRAIVQEVDAVNGTITVILTEGMKTRAERVRTFNLARPDLPVTDAADKPKKLSDLQQDDRVFLKMMNDDVVAIRLAPPVVNGTLAKIDLKDRTLLVRTKIGDKTVLVPAAAKVYEQNQLVRFEDLKAGALIIVAFASDQKTVLEVRTGKTVTLPVAKLVKGTGMLLDVDHERRTVQLVSNTSAGDVTYLREVAVSKDASFGLMHKAKPFRDIPLSELGRGVKVQFWIDVETRKLAHLEVEMPTLGRRVVKTVDRERRQMTLTDADGERVLAFAPQVVVRTANGVSKLGDIQPGQGVSCALSADRKRVELVYILGK